MEHGGSVNRVALSATLYCLTGWGSFAPGIAFLAAAPVDGWLVARGRGHAVAHGRH